MKVLAISSSSRKSGNTSILLNRALAEINKEGIETEMILLSEQIIEPCKACWGCSGKKNCVHRNDNFREIFDKMKNADGIILGSPVHSANISANMQALLERSAVISDMNPGLFTHKIGAAVVAARRGGALNALDALNHFFLNHEMFVVGSTYWNMAYGRLPGDVENDAEGLSCMENMGKNMAFLLKVLNSKA